MGHLTSWFPQGCLGHAQGTCDCMSPIFVFGSDSLLLQMAYGNKHVTACSINIFEQWLYCSSYGTWQYIHVSIHSHLSTRLAAMYCSYTNSNTDVAVYPVFNFGSQVLLLQMAKAIHSLQALQYTRKEGSML